MIAYGRLDGWFWERLRRPRTYGVAGLLLGIFAAFLAIPPIMTRTILWPILVGILAIAFGIWTITRGDLSYALLRAHDLSGLDLRAINGHELDLSESSLADADLRGADLTRARLAHTQLRGADLQDAIVDGVDLSAALIEGAKLDLAGAVQLARSLGAEVG